MKKALTQADVIAAEDTRVFTTLLRRLHITTEASVMAYFEGNERSRTPLLIEKMTAGACVALITDAGMPTVSDPGYRLVVAAIEAGIPVSATPGPSAVVTALAVSGLPSDRFCFEGFMPRKAGERRRKLAALAREERTMVFFEAPHRLDAFLADALSVFGEDRRGVVCRELTKPYEEIRRASLRELAEWAQAGVRGEMTVVIEGARLECSLDDALEIVFERIDAGAKLSSVVADVAASTGVNRRSLYELALAKKENR